LHDRVEKLESTVAKMMPSRRDALKLGAAGIAGAAGLSATSQSAEASTGSAGTIGSSSDRPDVFADTVDANQLSGVSTGANRQGCRVFLSSDQNIIASSNVKIQFGSKSYDSDNNFDISSHAWTCPADGLYAVNLQVGFTGGGSDQRRGVFIGTETTFAPNNEGAKLRQNSSDINDKCSVSTVNKYNSGDTIAAYVRNSDSSDTLSGGTANNRTFMEVAFLGRLWLFEINIMTVLIPNHTRTTTQTHTHTRI